MGFSLRHCTSKKIRPADSLEGNRDAGMRVWKYESSKVTWDSVELVRLLMAPSYRAGVWFSFYGYKLIKATSDNYQTGSMNQ
jgi:hypothetical protein